MKTQNINQPDQEGKDGLSDHPFEQKGSGKTMTPPAFQLKANSEVNQNSLQLKGGGESSGPGSGSGGGGTGLPGELKSGIEGLSGYSMDDVKVHYNSSEPAQMQAHAYAQGTDIHIGPGQEQHLPHEAWHVVQQKQGRVKPTVQLKGKVAVNDDAGLEREADEMGAKALQMKSEGPVTSSGLGFAGGSEVVQRAIWYEGSVPEFQIDGNKPSFIGDVKAMVLLASQSRDHIVPYAAIENDLAVLLNQYLANPGNTTDLTNFSEALFPNKIGNSSYDAMVQHRTRLLNTLAAGTTGNYQAHARSFLSRLNSSTDNIRAGDSSLNSSIGESLDTDFIPGFQTVAFGGLAVVGSSGAQMLPAGTNYLRLNPGSESVLYEYQNHTTQELSFVLNPTTNTQVSSVDAPSPTGGAAPATVSGLPVVVFDPAGTGVPFLYQ